MSDSYYCTDTFVSESSSQSDLAFTTEPIQFGRVAPVPAAPAPAAVVPTPAVVPAANRGPQARDWCFTCNNFTDDQLHAFSTAVDDGKAAYVCFGVEVGEQGTRHLQGFVQFTARQYVSKCKNIVNGPHYEPRRGSVQQAVDYCKKDGHFVEFGTCAGFDTLVKGQRNDLVKACECKNVSELADQFPVVFVKFHKGFEALFNERFQKNGKQAPDVHWICGPTGCGKTRLAVELSTNVPWISSDKLQWFDGYTDQTDAIFDDFRKESCAFNWFLRLIDRYAVRAPIKGGHCWFNPKQIFITCPRLPQDEFVRHGAEGNTVYEDVEQVVRRCTTIRQWNVALQRFTFVKGAPMHE